MKTHINSILIPTDFSELSESALKVAIAIAKRHDAQITLTTCNELFFFHTTDRSFFTRFSK